MKKIILVILVGLFVSSIGYASDVFIELKGIRFYPSEEVFKDIYGSGMAYGGEIAVGLFKNFDLWIGANYFKKTGELSFTKEETTIKIIPIGWGLRYRFSIGAVNLYTGGGISYYDFNETNPIGDVSTARMGYSLKIGGFVKIIKGLFIDIYFNYSYCKISPAAFEANIGGYSTGVGIGYYLPLKLEK